MCCRVHVGESLHNLRKCIVTQRSEKRILNHTHAILLLMQCACDAYTNIGATECNSDLSKSSDLNT